MRVRDQPTVQVEERIAAEPDQLWRVVTDITLPTRTSEELRSVEWLDDAESVAVGARFRGTNRRDDLGEWTTECVVVEVEPGRRWVWDVHGSDGVMATWGFEIDPGRDATRVRQWARMGTAPSGVTMAIDANPDAEGRIVSSRMEHWRRSMEANLAAVRAALEGPGAA